MELTSVNREWTRPTDYRQLRDRWYTCLLDGSAGEGDALPSVRSVAADARVNPLTVRLSAGEAWSTRRGRDVRPTGSPRRLRTQEVPQQ
jgi:hypothetical protein